MSLPKIKRKCRAPKTSSSSKCKKNTKRLFSEDHRLFTKSPFIQESQNFEGLRKVHQSMINRFNDKIEKNKIMSGRFFSPLALRMKITNFKKYEISFNYQKLLQEVLKLNLFLVMNQFRIIKTVGMITYSHK